MNYRGIHPSFLGHIDLTVCSSNDPGTTGLLSPFGKMDGLYFDGSDEPDNFIFELKEQIEEMVKKKEVQHVTISFERKEDFYKMMNEFQRWNDSNVKAYVTSLEDDMSITVLDEEDLDEKASNK